MNEHAALTIQGDILFTVCGKKTVVTEHFIPEHVLAHIYSGSVSITDADKKYQFHRGDTLLLRKNLLAKFVNHPSGEIPFKSMLIVLTRQTLRKFYTGREAKKVREKKNTGVRTFAPHPALNGLFNSLLPYYEVDHMIPDELLTLKFQEAITVLRQLDSTSDALLADFSEPGKIDLVEFMDKNYSFNIPLKRFAYLTGRSLAAFKRDFQRSFDATPEKWLRKKRLERAHFLISETAKRPSEVYLEVGFETFSHFSFAFKKMFGYSPSSIAKTDGELFTT